MQPAISTRDLTKVYPAVVAVDHVSLELARGTVFGLLGPNGAGKTTLLRVLTTLTRPTSGSATIEGLDVAREGLAVRRLIGVMAQENYLDTYLTARENLVFHAKMHGMPAAAYEARVDELLRFTQLEGRQHDSPRDFSGGMRRRLVFARALVHQPRVLFLDEPTTGLDPQARRAVWDYVAALREQMTIFLTTHYMEEADRLCDRVAIMDQGKILVDDSPPALKRRLGGAQRCEIEVHRAGEGYARAMAALPYVGGVRLAGGTLFVELRPGASIKALLERFAAPDLGQVSVHEPTLEDVFIQLTGRSLRE